MGEMLASSAGARLLRQVSRPAPFATSLPQTDTSQSPVPRRGLPSSRAGRDGVGSSAALTQPEVQTVGETSARLCRVQHQVGIPDVEVAVNTLWHWHQLQLLDPPNLQPGLLACPGELFVVQLLRHGSGTRCSAERVWDLVDPGVGLNQERPEEPFSPPLYRIRLAERRGPKREGLSAQAVVACKEHIPSQRERRAQYQTSTTFPGITEESESLKTEIRRKLIETPGKASSEKRRFLWQLMEKINNKNWLAHRFQKTGYLDNNHPNHQRHHFIGQSLHSWAEVSLCLDLPRLNKS